MRLVHAKAVAAVALLTVVPSCAFVSELLGEKSGPADANALVRAVEKAQVEMEASRQKMLAAVQGLQKITEPDFQGDAVSAHKELEALIERSEDQADDLRASISNMHDASAPVFEQWQRDLEAFTNPEMRQRSQARLTAARERYDAVIAAVEPALAGFDAVNHTLQDHALFLSHDLNPTAVSVIQDDVRALAKEAADLDATFNSGRAAARAYVESSALPSATPRATPDKPLPVSGP
jgi:hypothetical protein